MLSAGRSTRQPRRNTALPHHNIAPPREFSFFARKGTVAPCWCGMSRQGRQQPGFGLRTGRVLTPAGTPVRPGLVAGRSTAPPRRSIRPPRRNTVLPRKCLSWHGMLCGQKSCLEYTCWGLPSQLLAHSQECSFLLSRCQTASFPPPPLLCPAGRSIRPPTAQVGQPRRAAGRRRRRRATAPRGQSTARPTPLCRPPVVPASRQRSSVEPPGRFSCPVRCAQRPAFHFPLHACLPTALLSPASRCFLVPAVLLLASALYPL